MTCKCRKKVLSYGIARCKEPSRKPYTVFYDDDESNREAIIYKGPPFKGPFFTVTTSDLEPCTHKELERFRKKYPELRDHIVAEWMTQHTERCQAEQGTVTLTPPEADALRDLLEYVRQGWVGQHAQTIRMLLKKVAL